MSIFKRKPPEQEVAVWYQTANLRIENGKLQQYFGRDFVSPQHAEFLKVRGVIAYSWPDNSLPDGEWRDVPQGKSP